MTVENEWFTIIALSAAQLTITYQLSPTILYNSHCSLIGRAYHAGIRLQALRYITKAFQTQTLPGQGNNP